MSGPGPTRRVLSAFRFEVPRPPAWGRGARARRGLASRGARTSRLSFGGSTGRTGVGPMGVGLVTDRGREADRQTILRASNSMCLPAIHENLAPGGPEPTAARMRPDARDQIPRPRVEVIRNTYRLTSRGDPRDCIYVFMLASGRVECGAEGNRRTRAVHAIYGFSFVAAGDRPIGNPNGRESSLESS